MNQTAADVAATVSLILSASLENNEFFAYEDYRAARHDIELVMKKQFPGVKVASGAYRTALVFNDLVVKFSRDECRQTEIRDEADFINHMRNDEKYGRHFPETYVVDVGSVPVLVQEKVNMSHKGISWADRTQVEHLANRLGISDMHDGNYGWKGPKGKRYPVFVDVDLRYNNGWNNNRRSWHETWHV